MDMFSKDAYKSVFYKIAVATLRKLIRNSRRSTGITNWRDPKQLPPGVADMYAPALEKNN